MKPSIVNKATAEADLAIRVAVVVGSEILVPAASYYENSTARKLLDQYHGVDYHDSFYLVGSGNSLSDFVDEKLEQYASTTLIGARYRKKLLQPFPWRTRRRSSTADIKSDWLAAPQSSDIIADMVGDQGVRGRAPERDWLRLPERLGKTAFTPENAWKLMPSLHTNFIARRNLSAFINNAYFSSYLKDVRAGILQRLPWLSGGLEIKSKHRELDIDFASLLTALRERDILDEFRNCPVRSILRFRSDERFISAFAATQGVPGLQEALTSGPAAAKPTTTVLQVKSPAMIEPSLPKNFIVAAARQELTAIRDRLAELKLDRQDDLVLGNRRLEIFNLPTKTGSHIPVGLMMPIEKGKSQMKALLDAIAQHANPLHIVMVGMMAGLKGKASLLDVVVPRTVYDLTAIGTKDGHHVGEPEVGTMDAKMHQWVSSMPIPSDYPADFRLIPHKKTVTVSAKIDDISHELAKAALAVDPENVVGIEMEAAALTELQSTQSLNGRTIGHLMIKAVADYAGDQPDDAEILILKQIPNIAKHAENPDPTKSTFFKAALQYEATRRALNLSLDLIKALPGSQ